MNKFLFVGDALINFDKISIIRIDGKNKILIRTTDGFDYTVKAGEKNFVELVQKLDREDLIVSL